MQRYFSFKKRVVLDELVKLLVLAAGNILEFQAEMHDHSRCESTRYDLITAAHHPAMKTFNGGAEFTVQKLYLGDCGQRSIGARQTSAGHATFADVYYLCQDILINGQYIFIYPVTRVFPSFIIYGIHGNLRKCLTNCSIAMAWNEVVVGKTDIHRR
jgi:hypothetical protein